MVTGSLALVATVAVLAFVAWKFIAGVFKLLSLAAILVIAVLIYTGGLV